ncbi:glycosyl transferase, family 9 [Thermosulfidibacter takaii ABI70S6]|uniref:Glycosyl transferase, family 9 n=1 Tax=Thermosulfidibacter takaii (strain DSM 17441 / JCM 13301 / NBRC 103674 / ABI70S6) TaxID=1298851 RepID=A0A0S3QRM6_THET7|nr:glycosyltransferase family 9 protein [Thermosulfidibacter takaii]BAT70963.1 glycosyl transferase, family 9 [Thermosulfidibacter takaii ABI70S6]
MATLIVRPDKVGDLVLATPVAEAIKTNYPDEKVIFLCSSYAKDVLSNNPFIDEVIDIEKNSPAEEIANHLKDKNISKAVVLFSTYPISAALYTLRIPIRCTSGFRWYQFLYNRVVYLRRSQCKMKEWEYNLKLAKEVFPKIEVRKFLPKVFPDEKLKERFSEILTNSKPKILVYPGGGGEKRWPVSKFVELCQQIERTIGLPIVVLGPQERDLKEAFKKWLWREKLNLKELIAFIANIDAMVTNNTGPMHIAASLKKPLVQIFDPRKACNPKRWGHEYPKTSILIPPVPFCKRCDKSCKYYDCMDLISVQTVLRELERCLSE